MKITPRNLIKELKEQTGSIWVNFYCEDDKTAKQLFEILRSLNFMWSHGEKLLDKTAKSGVLYVINKRDKAVLYRDFIKDEELKNGECYIGFTGERLQSKPYVCYDGATEYLFIFTDSTLISVPLSHYQSTRLSVKERDFSLTLEQEKALAFYESYQIKANLNIKKDDEKKVRQEWKQYLL